MPLAAICLAISRDPRISGVYSEPPGFWPKQRGKFLVGFEIALKLLWVCQKLYVGPPSAQLKCLALHRKHTSAQPRYWPELFKALEALFVFNA